MNHISYDWQQISDLSASSIIEAILLGRLWGQSLNLLFRNEKLSFKASPLLCAVLLKPWITRYLDG